MSTSTAATRHPVAWWLAKHERTEVWLACEIGCTNVHVCNIIRYRTTPSPGMAKDIAEITNLTLDAIYGEPVSLTDFNVQHEANKPGRQGKS